MSIQVNINLTSETYHRAMAVAAGQQKKVEQLLASVIQARFQPFPLDENHELMQREIEAYHQLHPALIKTHLGQYVAIYGGEIVDCAAELDEIADRIDEKYPDEVVLVRQVQPQPERVLNARSPRLIHALHNY